MKRNINLFVCGGLLLAAALCTALYHLWDESRASDSAETAVRQIEEQIAPPEPVFPEPEEEAAEPVSVSPSPLPQGEEMPILELDGNQYIGTLELTSKGITLPVMSEWLPQAKAVALPLFRQYLSGRSDCRGAQLLLTFRLPEGSGGGR